MNKNSSNCKNWDYWIVKFGGLPLNEVTEFMEKECCFKENSELCPDCRKYYLEKMLKK